MLISAQRLSKCVHLSLFMALLYHYFEELLKTSVQLPDEPVTVVCMCWQLCVRCGFWYLGGGKAANLNSHRYPNYVPGFCTAFREQLSLWCAAPVQRTRLHFWTCRPLFHKQTCLKTLLLMCHFDNRPAVRLCASVCSHYNAEQQWWW